MKQILLSLMLFSSPLFALECPKQELSCTLFRMGNNHAFQPVSTKTATFMGVNPNEPSLPADSCELHLGFDNVVRYLTKDHGLRVTVNDNGQLFLYVSQAYGAENPQFEATATKGSSYTIHYGDTKMTCIYDDLGKAGKIQD